ncbi:DIX domain-containing protein [Loa loa]|uniref:DIX domain-containing protein n=1 Tax=Loa loa TaxID=7209 RepID=A0A1I7VLD3_LOALO|nr:DIX domain-containing protein [Loa loa]EFO26936.2 DIX domain-containing protein [Loa loa]
MREEAAAVSTKVYYYLDDSTPYLSVVPVADDVITLGDFKKVFNKKGYKYFCKQLDEAIGCEVKVEIRDDSTKLVKSANGLIELVLLLSFENIYCSGTLPRASNKTSKGQLASAKLKNFNLRKRRSLHDLASENRDLLRAHRNKSDENSITTSSLSTVISKRAGEGLAELYASNSEDPYHVEDVNSRYFKHPGACTPFFPTLPLANPSGIPLCPRRQRRPRKERYRKAYVPSTISSVTESSMTSLSLPRIDVVTLPMKSGVFLGISVLSHDGGIFVSDIHNGGIVDMDGRIQVGDQIVQVNRSSFENLSDVEAIDLLRKAAASRRPITLYVAKRICSNSDKQADILSGIASETMPIDVSLWVESTKHNIVRPAKGLEEMVSVNDGDAILVAEETETDLEGAYAERRNGLPPSNRNCVKLKQLNSPNLNISLNIEDIARRRENEENEQQLDNLNVDMDPVIILKYMALPNSGLQIKNRKWLKIPVPMSFIGCDLIDWLMEHVHGITDRKAARIYASKLLAEGHIRHVVNKLTFTEKCYYIFEDSILSVRNKNKSDSSLGKAGAEVTTEVTYVGSPAPAHLSRTSARNTLSGKAMLDQSWPHSTVVSSGQRKSFCDSSTNDYASVMGPDVIDSALLTEAPTLKLSHHALPDRLDVEQRIDGCQVAQPPNTPNSLMHEQRNADSETEFELVEDNKLLIVQ